MRRATSGLAERLQVQPILAVVSSRPRGGGDLPRWSRDGASLYFSSGPAVFEVQLRLGTVASAESQRQLFAVDRSISDFDVTPDGQRFLILRAPSDDFLPTHVLVNWRAKLPR